MSTHQDLAQHVIISLCDHRVIAPSTAARRRMAQVVFRQCAPELLVFSGVDTHLHLELVCSRAAAREIVRRIEISLQRWLRLEVAFQHHCEPVRDQIHLRRTFFYILRQRERHGYDDDPYHDASSLPDLLGLRVLGRPTVATVCSWLPRTRREELLEVLGPVRLGEPAAIPAALLPAAAAAAAGQLELRGRSADVVAARCAAVAVAKGQLGNEQLARILVTSERTVRRLSAADPDPKLVLAVRLQARLRVGLRGSEERLVIGAAEQNGALELVV